MIKCPSKLGVEKNFLTMTKGICNKPSINIILTDEIMNTFPLRLRINTPTLTMSVQCCIGQQG